MNTEERKKAYLRRFLEGDDCQTSANFTQPNSSHNFDAPSSTGLGSSTFATNCGSRQFSRGLNDSQTVTSLELADTITASLDKLKKENDELKEKYERLTKMTQQTIIKAKELDNKVSRHKITALMEETGILKNFNDFEWFNTTESESLTNEIEELRSKKETCKNPIQKALLEKDLDQLAKKEAMTQKAREQIYEMIGNLNLKYYPSMLLNDGKIQLLEHLGSGGFANVWKAWDYEEAKIVAVKITKFPNDPNTLQFFNRHLKREQNIMESTNHKNVVSIYRKFDIGDDKAFAMEYCEGGDLASILNKVGKPFPEVEAHSILKQIIDGLLSLKSKPDDSSSEVIIHYDLKPANILFDGNMTPKIADFGLSKVSDDGNSLLLSTTGGGTRGYSAPETFDPSNKITISADTWSVGIIFYEMITKDFDLKQKLQIGSVEIPEGKMKKFSEGAKEFIALCLERDPHKRPTIKELAGHKYLSETPTPPKRKSKKEKSGKRI